MEPCPTALIIQVPKVGVHTEAGFHHLRSTLSSLSLCKPVAEMTHVSWEVSTWASHATLLTKVDPC